MTGLDQEEVVKLARQVLAFATENAALLRRMNDPEVESIERRGAADTRHWNLNKLASHAPVLAAFIVDQYGTDGGAS